VAVALGGFLIFVGLIIVGIFILGFMDVIDFSVIETEHLQGLFFGLLLVVGLIDLAAGIILWRR
jgi:hypothetical protein